MNVLTENIRTRRKALGMTQRELADCLDISDKTVSRWESGVQMPDAAIIPELSRVLGVSIGALYGEEQTIPEAHAGAAQMDPPLPAMASVNRRWIWLYCSAEVIGLFLTVLGIILLCLNAAPGLSRYNGSDTAMGYICGVVTGSAGILTVIAAKVLFTVFYRRARRFNLEYMNTDVNIGIVVIMFFCVAFLFVIPRLDCLPYNIIYVIITYSAALMLNLDLTLLKRRLSKLGGRMSTVVTVVSWSLGVASIVALIICSDLNVIIFREPAYLISDISDTELSLVNWMMVLVAEEWGHSVYYITLLVTALPLTVMLTMNMIELKLRLKRLRLRYIHEHGEAVPQPPRLKPWQWIATVVIVMLLIGGSVFYIQRVSRADDPERYREVVVITESMYPAIKAYDTVVIDTKVDPDSLQIGDIISYRTDNDMMITHRIIGIEDVDDTRLFTTQGDHNPRPDETTVTSEDIIGKYVRISVPSEIKDVDE